MVNRCSSREKFNHFFFTNDFKKKPCFVQFYIARIEEYFPTSHAVSSIHRYNKKPSPYSLGTRYIIRQFSGEENVVTMTPRYQNFLSTTINLDRVFQHQLKLFLHLGNCQLHSLNLHLQMNLKQNLTRYIVKRLGIYSSEQF